VPPVWSWCSDLCWSTLKSGFASATRPDSSSAAASLFLCLFPFFGPGIIADSSCALRLQFSHLLARFCFAVFIVPGRSSPVTLVLVSLLLGLMHHRPLLVSLGHPHFQAEFPSTGFCTTRSSGACADRWIWLHLFDFQSGFCVSRVPVRIPTVAPRAPAWLRSPVQSVCHSCLRVFLLRLVFHRPDLHEQSAVETELPGIPVPHRYRESCAKSWH
jgi:hypothetical protein